jgi:hypothetical protein
MTSIAVAMAEIVREGTWALRALGYPYGTAERAAGMLAWTEAVHGSGLTLLRLGEAAIIAGAARPQPRWSRDAEGGRLAEAQGKCLFECGPPALDLATADAKLGGGLGRAVLRGAIGTSLSGALGAMAAQRGLAAVVVYAPGAAEIVPVPPAGWICALPTPDGSAFLTGSLDHPLPEQSPEKLRVAGQGHRRGANRWRRRLLWHDRTGMHADAAAARRRRLAATPRACLPLRQPGRFCRSGDLVRARDAHLGPDLGALARPGRVRPLLGGSG